ncbi:YIEGIA domain-containing protein [Ammoniphilus sp. YIM 78166]|uniref:YIEGIA domain-containing protein n=1 Tax=Ammoniphilus sp. YIM 78166 TaxID=1644106 RepID=UPI00106F767A|nr:YIEGIA domain-containing protein [Ammoniphilus sp. YIM 78166]
MNNNEMISPDHLLLIITATIVGTVVRALTLKQDYRQYPSHPNGYLIHFVTGALAAALGAFIVPTLMTKNFVAVTFLSLAIQQFREVRKIERESLAELERTEYTSRGDSYIDGIAKTFEARNYHALLTAFVTGLTMQLLDQPKWVEVALGILAGAALFIFLRNFTKGLKVKDFATVTQGEIEIRGSDLYVDGLHVSNLVGEELAKNFFLKEGLAAIIQANEEHYRVTLEHLGQRNAILFEATRSVGKRRYAFQDLVDGKIVIVLVPIVKNFDLLKETILNTPLLESVKKSPQLMSINPAEGDKK